MTYLELVRDLARQTGTMGNADPIDGTISTLQSPDNDYLIDLISWIDWAWNSLQLEQDWYFMMKQGQVTTTASQSEVDVSSQVPDFRRLVPYTRPYNRRWIRVGGRDPIFIWRPEMWEGHATLWGDRNGRPRKASINFDNKLDLWPTPDDTYTITFKYLQEPQVLSQDDDEPILPERYHRIIVYRAMQEYAGYDETETQFQRAIQRESDLMTEMRREQLPQIRVIGTK